MGAPDILAFVEVLNAVPYYLYVHTYDSKSDHEFFKCSVCETGMSYDVKDADILPCCRIARKIAIQGYRAWEGTRMLSKYH